MEKEKEILQMSNITKTFPGVKALDCVSLDVRESEIMGLIGENGAGKSTLMKVLMGIYKADEGTIEIEGRKVSIESPSEAIKYGIGMVPQELNLNPYVSAAENVYLGNEITNRFKKIDWKLTNENAAMVMKQVGLDVPPETPVYKLSSAQQQLVQLSRLLATGAKLLIFDEPTASLTVKETDELLKLMKVLKEQGKSIIFITHHLEELIRVTDRITVMRDGKSVFVGNTEDMNVDMIIEQMAGKKVKKLTREQRMVGNEVMLKVEGFSRGKEFQDVSFEVRKGEIFGIGGLVGAGRTELISAIFGITKKTAGKLYFEGQEVNIKNPTDAIGLGMGFVPEERRKHGIFPILSVRENAMISIYDELFHGFMIQGNEAKRTTQEYVDKIRIKTPSIETKIQNLSGGNQQKVILARWLAAKTKLLFLDEPTRGIDVNAKGEIYELIREMTREGMTVIIVSSEHEELLLLSDRIMVMHEGKQKGIADASEMRQSDILEMALK